MKESEVKEAAKLIENLNYLERLKPENSFDVRYHETHCYGGGSYEEINGFLERVEASTRKFAEHLRIEEMDKIQKRLNELGVTLEPEEVEP